MATRMQQRRGTAAEWAAANPVLAAGEIGVTSDTKVIKFGDGTTAWADLASAYMRKGGKESVSEGAGQNTAYVSSLNDLLRSGWYNVSGATGAPDATNWWLVMVITHVYNGNYQRQIAYDMTGGTSRVMSRHCTGADPTLPASWQPWVDTNAATNPQIIQNTLVDAQGDLLIGTADNTVGRLPKGTPGQQLTVMPDGTSLQWTTPPSTDLSSRVPLATVQAAGDLIVGTANAAVGRLGMGGAGLVLTVNAAGTGLVWAVPTVSVAKTGDTMSGNLAIAATVPALVLNDLGSSSPNYKKTFIRHANDRLEIMDDSNSVILATIANDGHLNALALYDNGNRVYSLSNPPPSGGAVINQTLRGQLTVTSTSTNNPAEPNYQDFTIPAVNMAKTQLRYLGGGMSRDYSATPTPFIQAGIQLLNSTTLRVTTYVWYSAGTYNRSATVTPLSYELTEWA